MNTIMNLYRKPDPNRKVIKNPSNSPAIKLAQKENFALFMLQGMRQSLYHVNKIVDCSTILREIEFNISVIKRTQQLRKESKRAQNETK